MEEVFCFEPFLAKFGKSVSSPGGCSSIGRPIDIHLKR